VEVLVLDEVDQLLDGGFQKDIERIVACLPPQRQTLAFSATVPARVQAVLGLALQANHATVDVTGSAAEGTNDSHAAIDQVLCSWGGGGGRET
jgi:superfamily II DNA/RNA helicase